jgi:hypothetical protein
MAKAVNREKLKEDMVSWPKVWAGFDSDIPIGEEIVRAVRPFLIAMVEDNLASTTINRNMGNLWLLGGEIISWPHIDPELKDLDCEKLILRFVDEEGGPYSKHIATEEEQKTFDGTCRKLYRFLMRKPGRL